jgi:hypothetical protein
MLQLPLPHILWQSLSLNQPVLHALIWTKAGNQQARLQWMDMTMHIRPHIPILWFEKTRIESMARYGDFRFAALRLDADSKIDFERWQEEQNPDPLEAMSQLGGEGFKLSATYVSEQNSWCFTVVGTKGTKKHEDMGLSSWSDDLGEAVLMCWYKHYTLCDGGEWPLEDKTQRWG